MSVTTDITYWATTLKVWIACWVNDNAQREEYGEGSCECSWKRLILATSLIPILECYTVSSSYNVVEDTEVTADNCFTEANDAEIKKIFQLASSIINYRGDC